MLDAVLLARAQFAFTMAFHIIFPSFTIGLIAWIATLVSKRTSGGIQVNAVFRHDLPFQHCDRILDRIDGTPRIRSLANSLATRRL